MLWTYSSSFSSTVRGAGGRSLLGAAAAIMLMSWSATSPAQAAATSCPGDAAGITLPDGFCATIFADNIGHARQMAITPDGTLYVNTWSGIYYKNDTLPAGGFIVALKDKKGDGHADVIERFGETVASGGHGGTGIALYNGMVYAEINDRIVRYPLAGDEIAPKGTGETIVSGLPITGDHPMHPFLITPKGDLFVDLGSATNDCEMKNRFPHSPGNDPCTEKTTRAGIWRYDANKTNQRFSPAERFATGLRNGEGFSLDASGRVFVTQHGRDQLREDWPELYSARQGQDLPAEEIVELRQGADYGWPECYFDKGQKKLVLGPEYGGDGGKKVGICAERQGPVAFFPAHWAPNDMKIYLGKSFPNAYQGGAFVAFHGSWNRAPGPQGGYNVVFQPLADGKATGASVVFADGFAGAMRDPGRAAFRPSGLAVAPDGALFISDDVHGRIWRVTYQGGNPEAAVAAAPAPKGVTQAASAEALPPEGIHPDAGKGIGELPVPKGFTKEQVALGNRVFHGEVAEATCGGCHGSDAKGSPIAPDLTSGKWLWSDGSLQGLEKTIKNGVAEPKAHGGAMPPMGGVVLSQTDLDAVSAYVWALGHQVQ
jgi:glucose/arabinose dehydrogenase/mono/diheme cytochrome c family protein